MADDLVQHTVVADLGLCSILIANIFYIVSFVSTAWAVPKGKNNQQETYGYGLWRFCDTTPDGKVTCGTLPNPRFSEMDSWIRGSQAMITLGFICVILAMLVEVGYICVRSLNQKKIVVQIFTCLTIPSAVFTIIGIIVYGVKMDQVATEEGYKYVNLSWGFILANIAVAAIIAAGIAGVIEIKTNPKLDTKQESFIGLEERPATVETKPRY